MTNKGGVGPLCPSISSILKHSSLFRKAPGCVLGFRLRLTDFGTLIYMSVPIRKVGVQCLLVLASLGLPPGVLAAQDQDAETNFRKPKDDADLRYWLENMVWHHNFTKAEIAAATGLGKSEIDAALAKF